MKKHLSILAVTLLSSVGWSAAAQPVDGTLHLDDGDQTAPQSRPRGCNPACVLGVRG